MRKLQKLHIITLSTILMVAFQNCGQGGQIAQVPQEKAVAMSNAIEITPVITGTSDIPTAPTETPTPPTLTPTPTPAPPSNLPPTVVADIPVTPSPAPAPQPEPQVTPHVPPTTAGDTDTEPTPLADTSSDDSESGGACKHISPTDVMLNVHEVTTNSGDVLTIGDLDHSVSMNKTALLVHATATTEIRDIRLVLNDTGNFLLGQDSKLYNLKTPSTQSSGFKIDLAQPAKVTAGAAYLLTLNIDLDRQIVQAGSKCLLKPVLKTATLVAK
jgi:hypothetical protein